ncbi:MAG: hypothetical protein QXM31_03000 [Candidatus Woesearchaeota archaeon]
MSERLGFALVLLVAVASVAGILLMSGTEKTASAVYGEQTRGIATNACREVICPGHGVAYPLINSEGRPVVQDNGKLVCICPFR